jgi:glycosyltransferase involved in cell wall biosynthesis
MAEPSISVVVPVYNDARRVGAAIAAVLAQTRVPSEVIVVDDGSNDGTADVVRTFGEVVTYAAKPNGGPASARNHGIELASSDLVAFTDSDCRPAADWLERLVHGFDDGDVAGVGGVVRGIGTSAASVYADMRGLLDPRMSDEGQVEWVTTANACFRRSTLLEVGLFRERFGKPGGEELELCRRLLDGGYELRLVDDALVLHDHRATFSELLRTLGTYGEGHYILGELWPDLRPQHVRLGLVLSFLALYRIPGAV